ncbi:AAA family ATPase [Aliarcobacter skirrowii]|uniref:AAA family ATPase n=1 Tax=Aliarcobacter skirrowii TaxID=28200 RepID=UPI0029BE3D09|nr:AAA family ATPase [Aliarcobacter skirrowii]MDX4061350.1 AAA family ATPase [Aliarcobacter skirrowii]
MELVYLWVEDYKNIQKQGFNFSPRFRCEYDEEKNELNIIDKDETGEFYPKNFFGDNVNVTAIVGENGSGKSSLVKFIRLFLKIFLEENDRRSRFEPLSISQSLIVFYDKRKNKFLCLDYEINCNLKVKHDIEYILYEKVSYKNIDSLKDTIFPVLDYSLTYDRLIHNFRFREDEQNIKFQNFPNKSSRGIDFLDEEINTLKKIFQNYKELNTKKQWAIFEDFFHPQFITISFRRERLKNITNRGDDNQNIIQYLRDLKLRKEKITVEFFNLLNKVIENLDSEYISERFKKFKELKEEKCKFEVLCDKNNSVPNLKDRMFDWDIFKFDISNISEDEINYLLALSSTDIFGIDIIDKNDKKFNGLSFGEQQLLKVLNIIYFLANTKDIEKLLIFLDEIDIGFHPEWQKKVIKYILQLTKIMNNKEFHLLVSAHSPFILSDIPNQNIIFLNKNEEGNCKNVTNETTIGTFGANIHTLLSHGFFMKDGLMGEFAKDKIDLAIKYLNQKILTEDELNYCDNIISIIGEPIIKRELQRMLDSKRLSEIEVIKKQIAELQQELDKKENKK